MRVCVRGPGLFFALGAAIGGCYGDPVDVVSGHSYESVEEVAMGRGPNGVVMGHAKVSFTDGQYSWRISDLDCHGSYKVDGDEIIAETKIPCQVYGNPIRGKLDGDDIIWATQKYRRVD